MQTDPFLTPRLDNAEIEVSVTVRIQYTGDRYVVIPDSCLEAIGHNLLNFYRSTITPCDGYVVASRDDGNDAQGQVRVEWGDRDCDIPAWSVFSAETNASIAAYAEIHKLLASIDVPFNTYDWYVETCGEYKSSSVWQGK